MVEIPSIQIAKSGRATCRLCNKTVECGEVGLYFIYDVFNNNRVNRAWVHWGCFLKKHEEVWYG